MTMQELHVGPRQMTLGPSPRVARMRHTPASATGEELRARIAGDFQLTCPRISASCAKLVWLAFPSVWAHTR
jgi:hypothetical protein